MFDIDKFSSILENINLKYDTMSEFGKKASFDRTYISKYINKKLKNPPTPKILKKIADNSKGVTTYEELMEVCGYFNISEFSDKFIEEKMQDKFKASNEFLSEFLNVTQMNELFNILKTRIFEIDKDFNYGEEIERFAIKYNLDSKNKRKIYIFAMDLLENATKETNKMINFYNALNSFNKSKLKSNEQATKIPVLGSIPAGIPIEMVEDIIDYEDISEEMLKGGKQYFALKIKGDSMFPEYLNGDVIIVLKQDDCESGQDCVVAVNGDDATFKRVFKYDNGITLQPLNNAYMPLFYSNEDIINKPVKILGVVKQIRRDK